VNRRESNREWFIRQIVEGDSLLNGEVILRMASQLGIKLENKELFCLVARYVDQERSLSDVSMPISLYHAAVRAGRSLKNALYCYTGSRLYTVMLIEHGTETQAEVAEQLYTGISRMVDGPIQIGVGRVYKDLEKLSYSRTEAYEALDSVDTDIKISYVEDIYVSRSLTTHKLSREKRKIIELFRAGNLDQLKTDTTNLVETVRMESPVREDRPYPTSIRRTMVELLVEIMHISADAGVDVDGTLDYQDPYRKVFEIGGTPEILGCFFEIAELLIEKIKEQNSKSENNMMVRARKLIDEHIGDSSLSLSFVSEMLCITPEYFSAFFIREVGIGFNDYVTNLRVEMAKNYLTETNWKINAVAEKCGFRSSSYFIVVFRKQTGVTPGEYRNMKS